MTSRRAIGRLFVLGRGGGGVGGREDIQRS